MVKVVKKHTVVVNCISNRVQQTLKQKEQKEVILGEVENVNVNL